MSTVRNLWLASFVPRTQSRKHMQIFSFTAILFWILFDYGLLIYLDYFLSYWRNITYIAMSSLFYSSTKFSSKYIIKYKLWNIYLWSCMFMRTVFPLSYQKDCQVTERGHSLTMGRAIRKIWYLSYLHDKLSIYVRRKSSLMDIKEITKMNFWNVYDRWTVRLWVLGTKPAYVTTTTTNATVNTLSK